MGRGPNVTQRTSTGKRFQAAAVESGESMFRNEIVIKLRDARTTPHAAAMTMAQINAIPRHPRARVVIATTAAGSVQSETEVCVTAWEARPGATVVLYPIDTCSLDVPLISRDFRVR